jgi:hypothetical protein
MHIIYKLVIIFACLVLLASCNETDSTEPQIDDNILTLVDPEACDYWIDFRPMDEAKGQYRVTWDCELGEVHTYAVTFNGQELSITSGHFATVSAIPGETYSGVLHVDEVDYPFTIKIAQNLSSATCDNSTSTPHLAWALPSSNMHQFVEAHFTPEEDEDYFGVFLPANKREYTLPEHQYEYITLATLNSYNSTDKKFGAYSWSYRQFSFD